MKTIADMDDIINVSSKYSGIITKETPEQIQNYLLKSLIDVLSKNPFEYLTEIYKKEAIHAVGKYYNCEISNFTVDKKSLLKEVEFHWSWR